MPIHATAIVDPNAELDSTVEVGAYAVIEGGVRIGPHTRIWPHAYVATGSRIGSRCEIHPFALVGGLPQDRKFDGAPSYIRVGDETIIREGATLHRGSMAESETVVGRRCFLMGGAHVGHNCTIADDVVLANAALLGGHVSIGPGAFIGGGAAMHQFVRIGELVMVQGNAAIVMDVPSFMTYRGFYVAAPNVVGMRRAGFSADERHEIKECFRLLYRSGLMFREAIERADDLARTPPGRRLIDFLRAPSRRGIEGGSRAGSPLV